MNTSEWKRLIDEWESLWVALESLHEDVNQEMLLFFTGESPGPTLQMCKALGELKQQEAEARKSLEEIIEVFCAHKNDDLSLIGKALQQKSGDTGTIH